MKKLYIVISNNYDMYIHGVFSSERLAKKAINQTFCKSGVIYDLAKGWKETLIERLDNNSLFATKHNVDLSKKPIEELAKEYFEIKAIVLNDDSNNPLLLAYGE